MYCTLHAAVCVNVCALLAWRWHVVWTATTAASAAAATATATYAKRLNLLYLSGGRMAPEHGCCHIQRRPLVVLPATPRTRVWRRPKAQLRYLSANTSYFMHAARNTHLKRRLISGARVICENNILLSVPVSAALAKSASKLDSNNTQLSFQFKNRWNFCLFE